MDKKILINCSNLHSGGGVAVATSFLAQLFSQKRLDKNIGFIVSSLVHENLISLGIDLTHFENYRVVNYFGIKAIWSGLDKHFKGYDVVFTVFGPAYFFRKRCVHIFGFAQPSIAYPVNYYSRCLSFFPRIFYRLKFSIQKFFFVRADELIVELEHVDVALKQQRIFRRKLIHVIHSTVDDIYFKKSKWEILNFPPKKAKYRFGVISKNYPHKNLSCFPFVKKLLKEKYSLEVEFFVTFSDAEWAAIDSVFKEEIINIGSITLAQCPSFYQAMDGVVFPTLLECFSAVPIETMIMKKPLFASSLPFVVDCCGSNSIYFDPLDFNSIAKSIYDFFNLSELQRNNFVNKAYNFARSYPDAKARANAYMEVIKNSIVN